MRANTTGSPRNNDPLPTLQSAPADGYAPSNIANAYGFDEIPTNGDGTGQVIALTEAFGSPTIQNDLDVFCTNFNLPKTEVTTLYPEGKPTSADKLDAGWKDVKGWASETMLDVEWAHAMAPGAKIVVVVAPSDTNLDKNIISYATTNSNAMAGIVSMSWSTTEDSFSDTSDPLNGYANWFTNTNIIYVSVAGDSGRSVEWPGADSNVLSVGGTSLYYDKTKGTYSETAWNGSGGGVSKYESMPPYQRGWFSQGGGERCVPDVSYNANTYTGFSTYMTDPHTGQGGWFVAGGTSAGAPQWAALLARRASLGNYTGGLIHYQLYNTNSYHTNFFDILSGNNGYPAAVGYDLVTGLGSPVAYAIADPMQTVMNPSAKGKRVQSVTFGRLPVRTFPGASILLVASATSGLPVTFSSSASNVATLSNDLLTITGAGTASITAEQQGDPSWQASSVRQTLIVRKGTPVLQFTSSTYTATTGVPLYLSLINTSGLVPVFRSSSTNVGVVSSLSSSNCIVTILDHGSTTITASTSGGGNWNAAVARCVIQVK